MKNFIKIFYLLFLSILYTNLYAAEVSKICIDWNSCNNSISLTNYFDEYDYINGYFWDSIDFRTEKGYSFTNQSIWSVYSFSIWANFSNKSSSNLSTLVWRNWWTYHHLLIDNTGDYWNQFLAIHNWQWFKTNYSTRNLTWWHNIIVIVNSSEPTEKTKFYIDWSFVGSVNSAIDTNIWPINIVWNYRTTWDQKSMPLDEFWLWNRIISQSEINDLQYNSVTNIYSGLMYYNKFDKPNRTFNHIVEIWRNPFANPSFFNLNETTINTFSLFPIKTGPIEFISPSLIEFSDNQELTYVPYSVSTGPWESPSYNYIFPENQIQTANNFVIQTWPSNNPNLTLDASLFLDSNFSIENFKVYNWKWAKYNETQYGFKNILLCWQNISSWNNNGECRTYYPSKETLWWYGIPLLTFEDINFRNINYSFFNNSDWEKIYCIKNTNKCFDFDFSKNTVSQIMNPSWDVIISNSSYFNNQLVYIKLNKELNLNSSIISDTNSPFIFWTRKFLIINENNNLKIYNTSYSLISSYPDINVLDMIKYNNEIFFINTLNNKFYKIDLDWQIESIKFDKIQNEKIWKLSFYFDYQNNKKYIVFLVWKRWYRYDIDKNKLYRKDWLVSTDIVNWNELIFPIDRGTLKTEFIKFDN